jgi:predicted PurR-regulated permease PerM
MASGDPIPIRAVPALEESPGPPATVAEVAVNPRNVSLTVIAIIASLFALRYARPVVIPIAMAVGLAYALVPVVDWLRRRL